MRKARGGGGALVAPKLFQARQVVIAECRKKLLVVSWEATNAYCAFNVLEVDLLQGVRKIPQERQLDARLGLWKSSRSRREARVRHGGSPRQLLFKFSRNGSKGT